MNQTNMVIWCVIVVSQVIYLLMAAPASEGSPVLPDLFPLLLGAIALLEGVGVVVLLRVRAINPIRSGRLDPTSREGAAQLFVTLILVWVLAESVAIYGLVVRFQQFGPAYSLPFAVGGAFLMLLTRPWQSKLKKPVSLADLAQTGTPLG